MEQRGNHLLRRYAQSADERAFRDIVADYSPLVYGTALRRLRGDAALALDAAQMVFTDLARKARTLPADVLLGSWLHRHTCFVTSKIIRSEARRRARENAAAEMSALHDHQNDAWRELAPILDEAIQQLDPSDRSAITLRFIEGRNLRAVGEALRVSEDAAQKRVQRALEKLRRRCEARGVTLSSALLASLMADRMPVTLSASDMTRIAAAALADAAGRFSPAPFLLSFLSRKAALFLLPGAALLTGFLLWKYAAPHSTQSENLPRQGVATAPNASPEGAATEPVSFEPSVLPAEAASLPANPPDVMLVQVFDKSSRQPIPAAVIEASTSADPGAVQINNVVETLRAEASGLAAVTLPKPAVARFQLHVSHPRYSGWISIWDAGGEPIPQEHSVFLEPGVLIGGRVQDALGNALEGVSVRINRFWAGGDKIDRSNQRLDLRPFTARTDSSGAWSASHVPDSLLRNVSLRFSHPDYADTTVMAAPQILPSLRQREFTVTLVAGLRLFGRVADADGAPVARARVYYGAQFRSHRRETITDSNGLYQFSNLSRAREDEEPVTVVAEGFAPQVQNVSLGSPIAEVNFILTPGSVIRGRVLDASRQPIEGVRVSRERASPLPDDGITWSATTDSEGRFEWNGAPPEPQSFYFGHPRYMQLRSQMLRPGDHETLIIMPDRRKIFGAVTDASTGQPVSAFSVLPATGSESGLSRWSSGDEKDFKGGEFEIELREQEHNVLRVQADGYLSRIAVIPAGGDGVHVLLQPSQEISGVILAPDGRPAAGAEVALLGQNRSGSATLAKGRFPERQRPADHIVAAGDGTFSIKPTASVNWIIAVDERGFAEAPLSAFLATKQLVLLPWARVEGVLKNNGAPWSRQEVVLTSGSAEPAALRLDFASFRALTDEQGRFVFDMVPPRPLTAARLEPVGPGSYTFRDQTVFRAAAGASAQIEINSSAAP